MIKCVIKALCLSVFTCFFTGSDAWSMDTPLNQDKATQAFTDMFGAPQTVSEMKSDKDQLFLAKTHKQGNHYFRSGVTQIHAKGESKEMWGALKKELAMQMIFEVKWDSYILFNDGEEIVEYRHYHPGYFTIISSRAKFNIFGSEELDKYMDDKSAEFSRKGGQMADSNSTLDSITGMAMKAAGFGAGMIGDVLGQEFEGAEATKKIQESSNGARVMTESSLFSNRHYLIHYRMGRAHPDKAIPITLEGESFVVWHAMDTLQKEQEKARQTAILKSAYLIDQAILPEGRPARKGDYWKVGAGVFSDAIGLRSRRIQHHFGNVHLTRSDYDIDYNGHVSANLRLVASPNNLIHVVTAPSQVSSSTHETLDLKFVPKAGEVLWAFDDQQISSIELRGEVFARIDHDIKFFPDTVSVLNPKFISKYTSTILERKMGETDRHKRLFKQLQTIGSSLFSGWNHLPTSEEVL